MNKLRLVLIVLFVVAGIAGSLWLWLRTPTGEKIQERAAGAQSKLREVRNRPEVVQGEIDATQFNIAAKIAGRIIRFHVTPGQRVQPGDPLLEIDSPELQAKREQARAAQEQAAAISEKAERGARPEEIDQARGALERAEVAENLARLTYERMERLFRDGVVPEQRKDEAEAQWKASTSASRMARRGLEMAQQGAREEDKLAAAAAVRRAQAAVAEVESFARELQLFAPQAGEIARINAEPGELIGAGFPVITLRGDDRHLVLNLREDRVAVVSMGTRLRGEVPALGMASIEFEVDRLSTQADFATVRATSASGGFDLRTIEVRARPLTRREDLRPGMTVVVPWNQSEQTP
jgi:HlyD family secretion protein